MNSFGKNNNNQSDIFILNNFEPSQSKIPSSNIFRSKLQSSIQNIQQLSKPIILDIDDKLQPLQKPPLSNTIRKIDSNRSTATNWKEDEKETTRKQLKFSQISLKNYQSQDQLNQQQSYQYKQKDHQYKQKEQFSQLKQLILSHYSSSTTVKTITTLKECFNYIDDYNCSKLIAIPSNIILEILRQREEMQHQSTQQKRLLLQYKRQEEEN